MLIGNYSFSSDFFERLGCDQRMHRSFGSLPNSAAEAWLIPFRTIGSIFPEIRLDRNIPIVPLMPSPCLRSLVPVTTEIGMIEKPRGVRHSCIFVSAEAFPE